MTSWANKPMPPFNNHLGLVVEQWQENYIKMSAEPKPEHLNRSDIPHGGFISALLDATTALAEAYSEDPYDYKKALTLSLTSIFLVKHNLIHFMPSEKSQYQVEIYIMPLPKWMTL